jgi:hypothetical protein
VQEHTSRRTHCPLTTARTERKSTAKAMLIWQLSASRARLLSVRDSTSRPVGAFHAENSIFQTVICLPNTILFAAAVQKTLRIASAVSLLEEGRPS